MTSCQLDAYWMPKRILRSFSNGLSRLITSHKRTWTLIIKNGLPNLIPFLREDRRQAICRTSIQPASIAASSSPFLNISKDLATSHYPYMPFIVIVAVAKILLSLAHQSSSLVKVRILPNILILESVGRCGRGKPPLIAFRKIISVARHRSVPE